jgi:hypothetical protein
MLLGGPGEIGRAGQGRPAGPDDLLAADDRRGEDLVLEIAVEQARFRGEFEHSLGLPDVAPERLLAGHTHEFGLAGDDGVMDLLHDLPARVVRGADPDRPDARVGGHGRDGPVGLGLADAERPGQGAGLTGPLAVGIEDAQDVGVTDPHPGTDVEAGDETAADDADAEGT